MSIDLQDCGSWLRTGMKRPASLGGQDLLYCDKDWFSAYDDDPPEVMADNIIEILKHNLDLHIAGNRTPLAPLSPLPGMGHAGLAVG